MDERPGNLPGGCFSVVEEPCHFAEVSVNVCLPKLNEFTVFRKKEKGKKERLKIDFPLPTSDL
jgi:hypothetical protein